MSIDRLRRFIGDMTSLVGGAWQDKDEAAIVEVGRKLLGELVSHDDWLPEQAAKVPAHGYAQNLLWCDPFERFCIVSFVWARQGRTTAGTWGYYGPRPPAGGGVHNYHFQVFALDTRLTLGDEATREQVVEALRGHVLAFGELVGWYARQ
jgi:hypothetical protein